MLHQTLIPWTKKLTILAALIALVATIYAFGAATPQEALASSHVQSVPHGWSLTPSGLVIGDKFRLIFLSSEKRTATPTGIAAYNDWIVANAREGHPAIVPYSNGFKVVGCTAAVDARDSTATTGTGVPIYWLNGNKVADDYADFYDGSWDDEANDKNELGTDAHDTSQTENYPYTGCAHNGTESFDDPFSFALGDTGGVRVARPNSTINQHGPLFSNLFIDPSSERPMYGLSKVFTVVPGNTGTLTTGGTPRSDTLDSSDTGHYWQVRLHQNGKYRIDVKGSESSQYGGTITNPRIQVIAGSPDIQILNSNSSGVYQTMTTTVATGGGAGHNSRLDIKVTGETKYYFLLVHRGTGDDGSYTLTANRLEYPQGRLAPDITVDQENRNSVSISWTESKKTHNSLVAPETTYEIDRRTLPEENWSSVARRISPSNRTYEVAGLTAGTAYEIRVRMVPIPGVDSHTYQYGYATVYTDDCATSGSNTCDINVNQSKKGRIGYDSYGDLDGYTVRLTSGTTYVIRANGKATNTGTLVDPYLELIRASDDSLIREDDDGGTGFNSKLTYTPTSTGDYKIVVSSAVDERGTYRVKVKQK